MVKDYSAVPVTATITCSVEAGVSINLFKTNLSVKLDNGDQLKLKLTTSAEVIYYTQLCDNVDGLSIETA